MCIVPGSGHSISVTGSPAETALRPQMQALVSLLEPHFKLLVAQVIDESYVVLVALQMYQRMCCEGWEADDEKFVRRPGHADRKGQYMEYIQDLPFD